jgi:hypothetical protein
MTSALHMHGENFGAATLRLGKPNAAATDDFTQRYLWSHHSVGLVT